VSGFRVTGLSWLGVRTSDGASLRQLFERVLGMEAFVETPTFVALRLPDRSVVEIFAADDASHDHFDTGPVAGFEVDDIDAAAAALEGAGVPLIGTIVRGGKGSRWLHFRGPDGHVYELLQSAPDGAA
jgi:predicted enzyme related to lactoylglutathione lyase